MKKIHLGGTCGQSNWRDELMQMLDLSVMECHNPIVEHWEWNIEEAIDKEKRFNNSDYLVYVITPEITGYSAIASAVDYSNKAPDKILFCVLYDYNGHHFSEHQVQSLHSVSNIISKNGGRVFKNLKNLAEFLNKNCNIK